MTIARTQLGAFRGSTGISQFRGIPYATAERFRAPVPVSPWEGARDARRAGPIAPQSPAHQLLTRATESATQDEACLTLSIATPAMPPPREFSDVNPDFCSRPVIVFIHGGGYQGGTGSTDLYDPSMICADGDLVFVKVNYRLGAMGFIYLPGVAEGNMGLLDIIAALRWIQMHIGHFGGDSRNITVFGHEAGAHAIMCLLTMWDSQGLFHRAIFASCPIGITPQSHEIALQKGIQLCEAAGVERNQLKGLSTTQIISAQTKMARSIARFADLEMPFMPIFDDLNGRSGSGRFIAAVAKAAASRGIDMMIGTTREEMQAILLRDTALQPPFASAIANRFDELTGSADTISLYRHRRAGGNDCDLLVDLMTDHLYLFPSLTFAESLVEGGGQAWVYQFDWAPRGSRMRACQGIDLACLFGNAANWAETEMLNGADRGEFLSIGAALRAAFGEFVHTNDPDAPGLPWPPYRHTSRMTMRFDTALGPVGDLAGAGWRSGN